MEVRTYDLKIGVRTEFDKGFMNQFIYLTYCGMPNSDTFCITRELLEYESMVS